MDTISKTHWVYIESEDKWYQTEDTGNLLDRPESHILWDATPEEARAILDARDGLPEGFTRHSYVTYMTKGPFQQLYHSALVPQPYVFLRDDGGLYRVLDRSYDPESVGFSRTDVLEHLERSAASSVLPIHLVKIQVYQILNLLQQNDPGPPARFLSPSLRIERCDGVLGYCLKSGDFEDAWRRQTARVRRKRDKRRKEREARETADRNRRAFRDMIENLTGVREKAAAFLPEGACVDVPCSFRSVQMGQDLFGWLTNFLGLAEALGVRKKVAKIVKEWEEQWNGIPDINASEPVTVKALQAYAAARGIRPGRLYPPHWIVQAEKSSGDVFTSEEVTDADRRRRKKVKNV